MHTEGPSPSFHWLLKDDICWVEMDCILEVTKPLIAGIGCRFILHENIKKSITKLFQENEETDGNWTKG
jgi:hypothetical protein